MSKPVKELMRKELISRFEGVTSLAVVDLTGVNAVANNMIRARLRDKGIRLTVVKNIHRLRDKGIRLTVVKNILARQAFKEVGLAQAGDMLEGPCAITSGGDNVVSMVRELLDIAKEVPALTVKAALLEGEVFPAERIVELSKYPTRDEAIAAVVACALSPGRKLAGCVLAPGSAIAGILKTLEEKGDAEAAEAA